MVHGWAGRHDSHIGRSVHECTATREDCKRARDCAAGASAVRAGAERIGIQSMHALLPFWWAGSYGLLDFFLHFPSLRHPPVWHNGQFWRRS